MTTIPDASRFAQLVRAGVAIPVVRELTAGELDPLAAFAVLSAGEPYAVLLETTEAGAGDANFSIVAPRARSIVRGSDVLDRVREACCDELVDVGVALPRFVGGAIGMLGHEHVCTIEPRVQPASAEHPSGAPDAAFLLVDTLFVFEHARGRSMAIHTVRVPDSLEGFDAPEAYAIAVAELDSIERALATGVVPESVTQPLGPEPAGDPHDAASSNLDPGEYLRIVEDAREQVLGGECVQIVVSQRFDRPCTADPLLAYRAVRAVSPAPYHVLLRMGVGHIIGASPEQLVGVLDERVVTHPIAGTRPRGDTDARDQQLERELLADPKERAEHMMLVDLGRNDVGRVAVPGSVRVVRLCEVERFSHVMHLVSRVEGDLRPELHPVDALRAAFPAGTLTGAPKVRAMEHIARLERDRRGPYGGVVGYVGHGRTLDMSITIRTAVLADGIASVQAGAGIVAASDPAMEEAETRHKARSVLAALALAQAAADGASSGAHADASVGAVT